MVGCAPTVAAARWWSDAAMSIVNHTLIGFLLCIVSSLLALITVPASAGATHGLETDPGFGHGGQEIVAGLQPAVVTSRPGGLLVVEPGVLGVAALTSSGQLDPTFGDAGRTTVDPARSDARAQAVTVDARGRIVVVGSASYAVPHTPATHDLGHVTVMAAARFLADGTPDSSFGAGGLVLLPFPDGSSRARSTVVLGDGSIVLAGSAQDGEVTAVAMLDDAGRLDAGFGSGGRLVIDAGPGSEGARTVLPVGQDKLVVAGVTSSFIAYAARVTRDGADPSFGDDGVFRVRGRSGDSAAVGAVATSDGRLLLPGRFRGRHGVLAVDVSGRVDRTYGKDGVAEAKTPEGLRLDGVVRAKVDPAGTISQAWEVFDPLTRRSHLMVRRFDAGGRPQGDAARVDFASTRSVNPIGILDGGGDRLLVFARAHGLDATVSGALVWLRPPSLHPAVRRCKRTGRPRSGRARCKRPEGP